MPEAGGRSRNLIQAAQLHTGYRQTRKQDIVEAGDAEVLWVAKGAEHSGQEERFMRWCGGVKRYGLFRMVISSVARVKDV